MVINVFGRRGAGKTTLIRGNLADMRPPVIIIDVLGNFENIGHESEDLSEAIALIQTYIEKRKSPLEPFTITLRTADPTTACNYLSAVIWEINGGTLVLDEVDSIDIEGGSCFDQFIRYGRNHHGDLITGCRRPAELHRNITAAANKFYCFGTHEFRDIEYFRASVFGDRAFELQRVPKYHGLYLNYDNHETGIFFIDPNGKVYHTGKDTVQKASNESDSLKEFTPHEGEE